MHAKIVINKAYENLQHPCKQNKSYTMFSCPISSLISMVAPSRVPKMRHPFIANFMFPVPDASLPGVLQNCIRATWELIWKKNSQGPEVLLLLPPLQCPEVQNCMRAPWELIWKMNSPRPWGAFTAHSFTSAFKTVLWYFSCYPPPLRMTYIKF